MKTRMVILPIILFATSLILAAADIEECSGIWINSQYDFAEHQPYKLLMTVDGNMSVFWYPKDEYPSRILKYEILDKQTDKDGNIWFKTRVYSDYKSIYEIIRISDSGEVYESQSWDFSDEYKVNPESVSYMIFYRQE